MPVENGFFRTRRALRRTALFVLLFIGLISSPIIGSIILNEIRLYIFAMQLERVPLPKYAEIIAQGSRMRGPSTSDSCNYEAVIVIEAWAVGDLAQQLAEVSFRPAVADSLEPPELTVYGTGPYYTVVLNDGGYDPNFDLRCW